MADQTINQLTEDTNPTSDDFIPSWDGTTGTTKKISLQNVKDKVMVTTSTITLGKATVTANQTGISTISDLTSLTLTVTVPAGGRDVEIIGSCQFNSSTADDYAHLYIYKDGSQVKQIGRNLRSGSVAEGADIFYHDTAPSAGSHTYKLRASGNTSVALIASATAPAQIVAKLV